MAMGIWSMTVVIAPVLGPVIGGWITDSFSWRWCFYINLPFGIISTYIVYSIFKKKGHKDKIEKVPIDKWGLTFLALGIAALQIMLDKGNDLDWFSSPFIVVLALMAFIFITILVIWEWHQENPVVNVKLFLNRNFAIGAITLTVSSMAFFASVVVIPLWLQNYMGYTALQSGMTTATLGISILFIAPVLGSVLNRLDARKVVVTGFILFSITAILTGNYPPDVTSTYISVSRFLTGIGLGMFFIPLNTITLSNIQPEDMAGASGLYNFTRNIGNSFGTSLAINFWDHRISMHHQDLISAINIGNPNYLSYIHQVEGPIQAKLALINQMITEQSALMGVNDIIIGSALLVLLLTPLIFLAKKSVVK